MEAEEEGQWEGSITTKGCHMGGSDNDDTNDAHTPPGVSSSGIVVCLGAGDNVRVRGGNRP